MDSLESIESYRSDGIMIVRGVINAAEIAELKAGCDELEFKARDLSEDTFWGDTFVNMFRNKDPFDKTLLNEPVVRGQIRRVTYPYLVSPILNKMRQHRKLLSAVSEILGRDIVQIVNQVNFNPPHSGAGWGWHQDYRFRRPGIEDMRSHFVQTIIAIDRCSEVNGGIRCVPKSDLCGALKLDIDPSTAEQFFDAKAAFTPVLEPGDVFFFNPYIIHGSTANKSDSQRRVYINGFASKSACPGHGQTVMMGGEIVPVAVGQKMEYEGDRATLPLSSKY